MKRPCKIKWTLEEMLFRWSHDNVLLNISSRFLTFSWYKIVSAFSTAEMLCYKYLKITMACDFFTLIVRRFSLTYLLILSNSLTLTSTYLHDRYNCTSSAYKWWVEQRMEGISFMYKENSIGPRAAPCGTPQFKLIVLDEFSLK